MSRLNLYQFTAISASQTTSAPISAMEFNISELLVSVENVPGCVGLCKMCGQSFKILTNIRRHYKEKHKFNFLGSRKRSTGNRTSQPSKKFKPGEWINSFRDPDDFVNNCLLMHTENALPYAFWNKKSTKRMNKPFMDYFGVNISGKSVSYFHI